MIVDPLVVIARVNDNSAGVVIVLVLTLLVVSGAFYFSKAARLKRQLKAAKRWPISELPEDTLGKVVGRARAVDQTLTAPISGKSCVAYEVTVRQQSGKHSTQIIHEVVSVSFMLEDESGTALIDPRGSNLVLTFDTTTRSGTLDDATPVEEAFLARHGKESRGWMFNKGLTYCEACIELGETIAVLGSGVREPDPNAAPAAEYRGTQPTRLRLNNARSLKLLISDDPGTTI